MRRGAQENQENQEYKAMQCALGAMRFSRRGQMRVMREAKKLLCYFYALNNLKYPGISKIPQNFLVNTQEYKSLQCVAGGFNDIQLESPDENYENGSLLPFLVNMIGGRKRKV